MMRRFFMSSLGIVFTSVILAILSGLRFFSFENDSAWLESPFFVVFAVAKALFFILVVPLVLLYVLKEDAREFGFRLPEPGHARTIIVALLAILLIAIGASFIPALREFYALPGTSISVFAASAGVLSLMYYAAEEFLFHGFLFWGLFRRIGMHSFWVTNLLFALLHVGKPAVEIPIAFFLGLLFSYIAWRTKSFLPAAALHFTLALTLNILVTFVWSSPLLGAPFHF